jgi:hypothetical protein
MADQAALNGGPRVRINSPLMEGVLGNLAGFSTDVASLAELQARLAAQDLKEATRRVGLPAAIMAGALALALGSLPVLLLGIAELIAPVLAVSHGLSLLVVAVVGLMVAGAIAGLVAPRIVRGFGSFRRSAEELDRNLSWIKTVLAQSRRSSAGGC